MCRLPAALLLRQETNLCLLILVIVESNKTCVFCVYIIFPIPNHYQGNNSNKKIIICFNNAIKAFLQKMVVVGELSMNL